MVRRARPGSSSAHPAYVAYLAPSWIPALAELTAQAVNIGLASQYVIWTRLGMLATSFGDEQTRREARGMVQEKIVATAKSIRVLSEVGLAVASAAPGAVLDPLAAERMVTEVVEGASRILDPYEQRVTHNVRRLATRR